MSIWSSFGRRWVALPDAASARLAIDAQQQSDALDNTTASFTTADETKIDNARETLTAARTYYVRTDGSDSNTGLVDSAGGAFLTVQKAIDTAAALDSSIYDVTIKLGTGTYTLTATTECKAVAGAGVVIIEGDTATPSNVLVTTATSGVRMFRVQNHKTTYRFRGLKLTATAGSNIFGLHAAKGGYLEYELMEFGSFGTAQHVNALDGGIISAIGNYTISGGALQHWVSSTGIIRVQGRTITISGTPAFATAFAQATALGAMYITGDTFSGSATGVRYDVIENSVIKTNGAGATYLPGDSAGTTATGGQYA